MIKLLKLNKTKLTSLPDKFIAEVNSSISKRLEDIELGLSGPKYWGTDNSSLRWEFLKRIACFVWRVIQSSKVFNLNWKFHCRPNLKTYINMHANINIQMCTILHHILLIDTKLGKLLNNPDFAI